MMNALIAAVAKSVLAAGISDPRKLIWGVYPSSSSSNDDTEVLTELTHAVRRATSRVQMAKVGEPLFIRHKPSIQRHLSSGDDRKDPTSQLDTVHLNPAYEGKISGKHVIVIDDCVTHGVSFGVAAALLRKAGAKSIDCLALGKFGNQLGAYDINVSASPFAPLAPSSYSVGQLRHFTRTLSDVNAQLRNLVQ